LPAAPGAELLPYQKLWANDTNRWKFGLMSRQVGKDFASGFEGIRDCVEAEIAGRKVDWLIAAPSERQSLESLQKWKDWAKAFKVAVEEEQLIREGGPESLLRSAAITFPGGSRVIAVPGRPETVRGFSANVLMTEFAFFEQPALTWRAIVPSITNPLKGGVKKVRLITTPNGVGNKAHEIWSKNYTGRDPVLGEVLPKGKWSCHFVPISKAVAEGLPIDMEELREAMNDPEGWAQEFDCEFLDTQAVLLSYELIATCESLEATAACSPEFWQATAAFPVVMGIDFGRHRDLSVAWSMAQLGDVQQTLEVLELDRVSTPAQVELLRPRIRAARKVCLDYTGGGIGLGDYLVKEFGEWSPNQHRFGKIELCVFNNALKVEVFSKLRMAFEKRAVRVPVSRVIREDLHLISRVTSPSGLITYRASHTPDGHADRCTALALAVRAGSEMAAPMKMERVQVRPELGDMGLGRVTNEIWM
jgi:phage FluMu gp28-like protein